MVTPIAAAVQRRGFIARADELIPGACYAAVDLAGACFSTPAHKARQKEWVSAGKASNVPSLSYHTVY